jgi:hypothetical protein
MAKRLFSPLRLKEPWNYEDFSVKLLEKELELEKNCGIHIIEELITLYSEAIEHFNELSDSRFYDFQDRLHKMLIRPEVASVVQGKGLQNLYHLAKRKTFCSEQIIKSKIIERENFSVLSRIKSEEMVGSTQKEKIKENVNKQDFDLNDRVFLRRSRVKSGELHNHDVSTKESYYLDEKDQVEMIMEKFYEKKAKEVSDVTLFYLMKMESADEITKNHLALEMKKEILRVSQKFDANKAHKLKKFKQLNKINS